MISVARTDVGMVREHNEDAYRLKIVNDRLAYGIVCDGMGGANGGQVASTLAADTVAEIFESFFENEMAPYDITNLFRRAIRTANDKVYKLNRDDPSLRGMGTTLVIAIAIQNEIYIANVGDSRAYLFFGDTVQQISVDHSAVQELLEQGKITREEAINHPQKNIITRAIGVESIVEFDYFTYNFRKGDQVLLCTDGLSNYCDEETLLRIIGEDESAVGAAERLINYANSQGGRDNITALLIKQDC